MLSVPDIAIIGAIALLVFGPEQLPRIARKVGTAMREVQNTSQQFIREMERAADDYEFKHPAAEPTPYAHEEAVTGASDAAAYAEPTLPGFDAPGAAEPPPAPSENGAPAKRPSEPSEF